jgi:hypothetical protein
VFYSVQLQRASVISNTFVICKKLDSSPHSVIESYICKYDVYRNILYSRQSVCYIRTMTASVQLGGKNTGRDPRGACRQDELIGGKPPVVK